MNKDLRCWAEIDLDAISDNFDIIKKSLPENTEILVIAKADGYGHGAANVARRLAKKADRFGVATKDEALLLRNSGIKNPILILGHSFPSEFEDLIKNDVTLCVSSFEEAKEISHVAEQIGKTAKIHLAFDTGMGRIGFSCDENSVNIAVEISKLPYILFDGIFSHFSKADEKDKTYSKMQTEKFNFVREKLRENNLTPTAHLFNSAAITDFESVFDMVRVGIILYGLFPSDDIRKETVSGLRPVMTLKSRITQIQKHKAGEKIGYGGTFETKEGSVIATVSAGYADGFPRALSNKGTVFVNEKPAPIVGRICMDQLMIDVTNIPDAKVYDEVVLFGDGKNGYMSADDVAKISGTINYEIICGINRRVPRVYISKDEIKEIKNLLN